jgi:UDP-N-acetylglucosamine/UDP-N-acetylgalactosamine diphosphorylase
MTSPATDAETREYFETEDYLGYEPRQIALFCQGTMPAIDAQNGKILLESKHQLFASPDGHGGLLAAMAKANLFDSLANDGVDILFYFQVDNPLVAIADPAFLGYHLLAGSEMTTQVVAKRDPLERVGNLVAIDGKLRVIEYSDLPDSAAERRTPSGELEIWAGSIAVHVFSLDFLERMSRSSDSLPFHRALKSVPFMNAMGQLETPATPNAIKFERFIFDILPHANNALVVEVDPAQGFAPVKNLHGVDSPDTARSAMVEQHRKWLRAAGAVVANDVCVEVHPGYAWDVKQLRDQIPDRFVVEHDTYFSPEGRGIE